MSKVIKLFISISVGMLGALLGAASGFYYSKAMPKLYSANTVISVERFGDMRSDLRGMAQAQQEDEVLKRVQAQIQSDAFLAEFVKVLSGLDDSKASPLRAREIRQGLRFDLYESSDLIEMAFISDRSDLAADTVNQLVERYAKQALSEKQLAQQQVVAKLAEEKAGKQSEMEILQSEMDSLPEDASEQKTSLQDKLRVKQGMIRMLDQRLSQQTTGLEVEPPVKVINPAIPIDYPIFPNVALITVFSGIAGFSVLFVLSLALLITVSRKRKNRIDQAK